MQELCCEDIMDMLDDYRIRYSSMINCKGIVMLDAKDILINPVYNQDLQTLIHEVAHIYYDGVLGLNMSENFIEYESQQFLRDNPSCGKTLEDYLILRTEHLRI